MSKTVQEAWIDRQAKKPALRGLGKEYLRRLVELGGGRCRWTGLPLKFDKQSGGPPTDPLYAEVDHREAGTNEQGHDIVCHRINDAKAQLPWKLWQALTKLPEFEEWMLSLQEEYKRTGSLRQPRSLQKGNDE